MRDWTDKETVKQLQIKLILQVYYEFVYKQRDINLWLAGMDVMNKIG